MVSSSHSMLCLSGVRKSSSHRVISQVTPQIELDHRRYLLSISRSLLAPSAQSMQMTSFPMPYGHQAPHSYSSSLPQQSVNDHYGDSIVARKTSLLGAPLQPSTPGASPSSSSSLDPCRSSVAMRSSIMCTIQVFLAIVPLSQNSTC